MRSRLAAWQAGRSASDLNGGVTVATAGWTTTLQAAPVPAAGTYYVNAAELFSVDVNGGVGCELADSNGTRTRILFISAPAPAVSAAQSVALTGVLTLAAGEAPAVVCVSYNGTTSTTNDGSITATLISSPFAAKVKAAAASGPGGAARKLPH